MKHNLKTDVNGNTAIHQRLLMENPLSQESFDFVLNLLSNPDLNINQKNNDDLRYIDLIMMHKELCRNITENNLLSTMKSRTDLEIGANSFGDTPMHYAAHADNFSGLIFLNQLNTVQEYVDAKNNQGQTAMHLAASRLNLASLITLKEVLNANPNLQDVDGNTPGHRLILSLCAYPELVVTEVFTMLQAAVRIGCDFSITNKQGLSMVGITIDQMSVSIFDAMFMVNKNLDINNLATTNCNLLHLTVQKNDYYFTKHLVNKGIDTNLKNSEGLTAQDLITTITGTQREQWIEAFTPDIVTSTDQIQLDKFLQESQRKLSDIQELISAN